MWVVQQSNLSSVSAFSQYATSQFFLCSSFLPSFPFLPSLLKMFTGIFSLLIVKMCPYYDVLFITNVPSMAFMFQFFADFFVYFPILGFPSLKSSSLLPSLP